MKSGFRRLENVVVSKSIISHIRPFLCLHCTTANVDLNKFELRIIAFLSEHINFSQTIVTGVRACFIGLTHSSNSYLLVQKCYRPT